MQYSAVIIALLTAKVLAVPVEVAQELTNTVDTVTEQYPPVVDTEYPAEEPSEEYPTGEEPAEEYPTGEEPSEEYPTSEYPVNTYEPVESKCWTPSEEPATKLYGGKPYFAEDEAAATEYTKYSDIESFYYPKEIVAGQDCPVTYKPKADAHYDGHYKVAVCNSSDGYKTCEDVCDSEESCKSYKPKDSYIPSDDSEKGCMYRFKVYRADNDKYCSYSEEYPIFNPVYYEKNVDCKPEPTKCPTPIYAIPAPKPVAPVTPVAPVYPAKNETAPVAPVYPTNDTATVPAVQPYDSGSSAVKASLSAIVGMAAIVAFAL